MSSKSVIKIPGAIDIHVHLREHSKSRVETIENGSFSASRGGYSLICDMPNDQGRPTWTIDRLKKKIAVAKREARVATL
ncbi:MAG: dihydroorotase, partial [Patescibacteria group bacterium]